MRGIFDGTEIRGLKLANRMVRSATWEGMCDEDGRPTIRLAELYRDLARGGVGLIVTGYTFVRPDGRQMPGTMGIHTDDFKDEMKGITAAVHEAGGRICMQMVHVGGQTKAEMIGRRPLAPSEVLLAQSDEMPEALSKEGIKDIVAAFGAGALRAREYGFDAVQLHAAHGYLINQFLSPLTNRREDEYGGSVENRCRFLMEVYNAVREAAGDDYPVMVKLSGSDNLEGGLSREDAIVAAKKLDEAGLDAIEVSGGTSASGPLAPVRGKIKPGENEAYNLELARGIKGAVSCPVMVVGGFRSMEAVEAALRVVDYVSLSRPLIREPGLPLRWKGGDLSPATCISCNKCFIGGLKEGGIYCYVERKKQEKGK